jgi:hypothetical protein
MGDKEREVWVARNVTRIESAVGVLMMATYFSRQLSEQLVSNIFGWDGLDGWARACSSATNGGTGRTRQGLCGCFERSCTLRCLCRLGATLTSSRREGGDGDAF